VGKKGKVHKTNKCPKTVKGTGGERRNGIRVEHFSFLLKLRRRTNKRCVICSISEDCHGKYRGREESAD